MSCSRFRAAAAVVLAAATLATPTPTGASGASPAGPAGPGELSRVIVALEPSASGDVLAAMDRLGVVRGLELRSIDAVAVTAPAAVIAQVAALPGVRAVAPQRKLQLHLYRSKEQINALGVREPARYQAGDETFERPGVTGEGVTVGIIDSGIFSAHPGFGDRVVGGLNFEFSMLAETGGIPAEQWDSYAETTGTSALQDEVGHGTHVAGTVGGDGGGTQSDRDLSGVAPGVTFVALKIASAVNGVVEDIGFEENALAAIDYLIRHPELDVKLTNNSWGLLEEEPGSVPGAGFPTDFDAAEAIVVKATQAGITMVFSAGNDGPEAGSINRSPGGAPEAITVAAACKGEDHGGSCPAGEIAPFSSRGAADGSGPQVDVSAPGDQILAPSSPSILLPLTECADPAEPLYYCISGTSMASPHVTGVVALMQQVNPELTPAQAEQCLTTTAADLLAPGRDIHSGFGMVDTARALECAHQVSGAAALGASGLAAAGQPASIAPAALAGTLGSGLPATGGSWALSLLGLLALGGTVLLRRLPADRRRAG